MKVQVRLWLYENGKAFGDGPYSLLKNVEETGSLRKGAKKMGMSYKKAWTIIKNCESRLGVKLLQKKKGGKKGGGSSLTETGKVFLRNYEEFKREVKNFAEKAFDHYFGRSFSETKKD